MKTKKKNLIFERGWMFSKEKLAVASANWFSGRWLYYNHFSLKNNLLTSCSTFMFQEKEEDLHVLQFGLDCQKVGGETVVQRFSWTLQSVVQAECGAVGGSCWADRVCGLTLSTCIYLWHPDTILPSLGRLQGHKPHDLQMWDSGANLFRQAEVRMSIPPGGRNLIKCLKNIKTWKAKA